MLSDIRLPLTFFQMGLTYEVCRHFSDTQISLQHKSILTLLTAISMKYIRHFMGNDVNDTSVHRALDAIGLIVTINIVDLVYYSLFNNYYGRLHTFLPTGKGGYFVVIW